MTCSMQWTLGHYDGRARGVGEHLSLFNVLNANLVRHVALPPVTHRTGGTSQGNPGAGTGGNPVVGTAAPTTSRDKVFAGLLTGAFVLLFGFFGWLITN